MNIAKIVGETKVFLLDMDGTIYIDETPIGDMNNTLARIRAAGKRIVYCTNNSSRTPDEYEEKLKRIGLWGEGDLVYTSAMATAEYLKKRHKDAGVYVVATDAVKESFAAAGVRLDEETPQVCVLAYDTTLTFEKLKKINRFIVEGATYIATHPDDVCPAKGVFPPDVGSFISLLKTSSGRTPDLICGKPYATMGDCLRRRLGVAANEVTMVGDRLHTDIRFGVNCGFHTILVMSGETTEKIRAASPDKAEACLPSLNDVVPFL